MFALASLFLFLAADEAAKPVVESCPVELAQVITQARDDFEARYSELGLVGAAPLPGTESLAKSEPVLASRADFDGSARLGSAAPLAVSHNPARQHARR